MAGITRKRSGPPDEPAVGTDRCRAGHVGPGGASTIEPAHDAWVEGGEPLAGFELERATAEAFARPGT